MLCSLVVCKRMNGNASMHVVLNVVSALCTVAELEVSFSHLTFLTNFPAIFYTFFFKSHIFYINFLNENTNVKPPCAFGSSRHFDMVPQSGKH